MSTAVFHTAPSLHLPCVAPAVLQRVELGAAAVGLAFSNTLQMLIFYTWAVRMMSDTISLMSSTEKVSRNTVSC